MPYEFKHLISLLRAKEQFAEQLQAAVGMTPEQAKDEAFKMSPGSLSQVYFDLTRAPYVSLSHKPTGVFSDSFEFNSERDAQQFLDLITQERSKQAYLTKYLQQGGFMNTAELLIMYYFSTVVNDEDKILLDVANRKSEITVEDDGSILFRESFDIPSIKLTDGTVYTPESGSVATITLESRISMNPQGELSHDFSDIQITAHDKIAEKLFHDPTGPMMKFLSWIKDVVQSIFSQSVREHNLEMAKIPTPRKKL